MSNLIFVVSPSIGGKRLLSMESLSDTRKVSVHENSVCTPCLKMPVFLMLVFKSVYKELHADHETGAADNK